MAVDPRTVDRALAALYAFRAEEPGMWPDDERSIAAAIGVLQKYSKSRTTR